MCSAQLRNIAVIAHVDHGKTTLVDRLLRETGVFRENQQVVERVLDSDDQERERGITIFAKNVSVRWRDVKINIIDTPGHADFGGEVERVLRMADGALLIVDAFEGAMPQTRFVVKKALEHGLIPLVVVNKIDRPGARPHEVVNGVFDLMVELGADDAQLDFTTVFASAAKGFASFDPAATAGDMVPLLEAILENIPAPDVNATSPLAMQVCTVDFSEYVGRIGIGRIYAGTLYQGDRVLVAKNDGRRFEADVKRLFTFEALGRVEAATVCAGDIVAVAGVDDVDIGDVLTCKHSPVVLDPIHTEEPTITVVISPNTSPLVGREGEIVGGRQLKERLMREAEANISMRIRETDDRAGIEVAGRGILHLAVLMETMRREGFEFQVGRPQVIYKHERGVLLEPYERAHVDAPNEYAGKVIEAFGRRGGELLEMALRDDRAHLEFSVPSRGIMGVRNRILNATRGEATLFHHFSVYAPHRGDFGSRSNGSLIAMGTDKAGAYALEGLQHRGTLFVGPGDQCYAGMVVGEHAKSGDLIVNVAKAKQLTNVRSSTKEQTVMLEPHVRFTLEEALEYIEDDELVEVTPDSIRIRKRTLDASERKKSEKRDAARRGAG